MGRQTMITAYAQLEARFAELSALQGATSILHWDSEVMLPSGSVGVRAQQLAALSRVCHGIITDPAISDLLSKAEQDAAALNEWQRANLRQMRRAFTHEAALPEALVVALTDATTRSEHAWRQARADNDFAAFLPHLTQVIALVREVAQAKQALLPDCATPYDALLDSYDEGLRTADVQALFAPLEDFLPDFVQAVMAYQRTLPPQSPCKQKVPIATQQAISRLLMQRFGFDFARGRADISAHPFCGGVAGDIRLTSRFDEGNLIEGLYATLHETGHALYEMGLPQQDPWCAQPVGQAGGMSLHESQSLFTEMQLGLRPSFVGYLAGLLQQQPELDAAQWTQGALQRQLLRVQPSMIRVTADEVTYPLHILLRTQLEQALLSGDLPPQDLPAAWADAMQARLGIRPQKDSEGCLQDTHWAGGAFGYFPTYSIGAMMAPQLMQTIEAQLPELDAQIARGEFAPIYDWLREKIHQHGSCLPARELLQRATDKPLNADAYIGHLQRRYLPS
jgi:carboxypeptidase Taq